MADLKEERNALLDEVKLISKSKYAPPIDIIDSSSPPSQDHLNRVFDYTPLTKKKSGFDTATLPTTIKKSPYLNTIGVPHEWNDSVVNVLKDLGTENMSDQVLSRFFVNMDLTWQTTHMVIDLVRKHKTSECYNTQGGLTKFDETLKPLLDMKWLVLHRHKTMLQMIARATKDPYDEVLLFDMSLRHKRAKRDPLKTVTTPEGRSFCFIGFYNEEGMHQLTWVDISRSDDVPQRHFTQAAPSYAGSKCNVAGCKVFLDLLTCSRCKKVFYCSSAHQKVDWPQHKKNCTCK